MGTIFKFMEFKFPENALIRGIFTHTPPPLKTLSNFLLSLPRQKEITHSHRQRFFRNLFPSAAEKSGENYGFLYQNSVKKYEDDLEH